MLNKLVDYFAGLFENRTKHILKHLRITFINVRYYDIVFLTEQQVQDWCVTLTTDGIGVISSG